MSYLLGYLNKYLFTSWHFKMITWMRLSLNRNKDIIIKHLNYNNNDVKSSTIM